MNGRRVTVLAAAVAAVGAVTSTGAAAGAVPQADQGLIGPLGYQELRLGQSEAQAESTGLLVDPDTSGPCHYYDLDPAAGQSNVGSGVFVDPARGVVMIGGTSKSHTPEGLTLGSTLAQVRAAYPELKQTEQDWVHTTPVPGHGEYTYRFAFDQSDHVSDFGVNTADLGAC